MPEIFSFDVETVNGDHLVYLRGELDLANAERLKDALIEAGRSTVVVDLSDLTFTDSSGIAALLAARRTITADGSGFVLRGASGVVRRVFEITGLAQLLAD